jgi:hypothetical protein
MCYLEVHGLPLQCQSPALIVCFGCTEDSWGSHLCSQFLLRRGALSLSSSVCLYSAENFLVPGGLFFLLSMCLILNIPALIFLLFQSVDIRANSIKHMYIEYSHTCAYTHCLAALHHSSLKHCDHFYTGDIICKLAVPPV